MRNKKDKISVKYKTNYLSLPDRNNETVIYFL